MSIKILAESRSGCGQVHGGKSFEAEFCKQGATHFYSFSLFFFFLVHEEKCTLLAVP